MLKQLLKPCLVYLIDDDTEDHIFFSMAIERMNASLECTFANSGLQAIDTLRSDPAFIPDFIFIDINMPLMNGVECLAELRKIRHIMNVPIYMYSTSKDPSVEKKCMEMGATGVIQKMSSITSMKTSLGEVLLR